jgi:hypothetical protein
MKNLNLEKFNDWQKEELRVGLEQGLDVSVYADPQYEWPQMRQIEKGLKAGLDVSIYADPKFEAQQMDAIRLGLEEGLDVSIYADPKFDWEQMHMIRNGLEKGLNVSFTPTRNLALNKWAKFITVLKMVWMYRLMPIRLLKLPKCGKSGAALKPA